MSNDDNILSVNQVMKLKKEAEDEINKIVRSLDEQVKPFKVNIDVYEDPALSRNAVKVELSVVAT